MTTVIIIIIIIIIIINYTYMGVGGGAVGWGTALQVGRSRVWFPMSVEFFFDIINPAAL